MKCRSYLPSVVLTTFITLTMTMSSLKTSENNDEFNKPFSAVSLYNKVQNLLEENKGLFDSSKDQNIVVFIGNTGSGKSTLINFLSDKELSVDPNGDVVLKDPEDVNSMKIGTGNQSETFFPKFIKLTDMTFFDVPGIGDTRGIEISLMNASFIKHIIEGAKSVRLVYVAGMDEITAARGTNFKELVKVTDKIVSKQNVQDCSVLVITKSQPRDKTKVKEKLLSKTESGILDRWFNENKFARFSAPSNDEIFMLEKEDIFLTILKSQPQRIEAINTSVLFGDKELGTLETIYTQEILNLVEKLIQSKSNFKNVDIDVLKNKSNILERIFQMIYY
ncbi:MAG: GTPase domain-containing protein [Janthinobacterium lividum]